MAGFFKSLFSGGEAKTGPRRVEHPDDLRPGDGLSFGRVDQPELSRQSFTVSRVDTYVYGSLAYPESAIAREGNEFYLMYEEEGSDHFLSVARLMTPEEMENLFDPGDLRAISNEMMTIAGLLPAQGYQAGAGEIKELALRPGRRGGALASWLAPRYFLQDRHLRGFFVEDDARYLGDEELSRRKEPFLDWVFVDLEDEKAVEFQLFDTGQVESALVVYLEPGDISKMQPGAWNAPSRLL